MVCPHLVCKMVWMNRIGVHRVLPARGTFFLIISQLATLPVLWLEEFLEAETVFLAPKSLITFQLFVDINLFFEFGVTLSTKGLSPVSFDAWGTPDQISEGKSLPFQKGQLLVCLFNKIQLFALRWKKLQNRKVKFCRKCSHLMTMTPSGFFNLSWSSQKFSWAIDFLFCN